MNRAIMIAAVGLLASTAAAAQAERGERDPDKMAVIAATILIFDRECEKVSLKLEEAGTLEAYIFFARANEGIVRDYSLYRKAKREKLKEYWLKFVVGAK